MTTSPEKMTSGSEILHTDTQCDSHLRSPFQLTKTKDTPLKLISLPQNVVSTSITGTRMFDMSPTSSTASSETSEPMSPKNLISPSPFSLSVKKVGSLCLTSALASPPQQGYSICTSTSREGLSQESKNFELQKEISSLKKVIEAKDAKLSSSMKSIKQFWSPELKKERAARKDEAEKYILLKEKYQISNTQIEEYKSTLEDLESELNSQQQQINNLSKELKEANDNSGDIDRLREEYYLLKDDREQQDKDISILSHTLDDLEDKYKQLEDDCNEKNKCISDLEIILVEQEKKEKDHEADTKELEVLYATISNREIEFQMLQKELNEYHAEVERLHKIEDGKDEDQFVKYDNEICSLRDTIKQLEDEVIKHERMFGSAQKDLEDLRKKDEESVDRINELEDLFLTKDKEYDKLQVELNTLELKIEENEKEKQNNERKSSTPAEIEWLKDVLQSKENELSATQKKMLTMRGKLQDSEKLADDLERQLKKIKSSDPTIELKEVITQKEREITDAAVKYEKLDKYLSEREVALEHCCAELKELTVKKASFNIVKDQLENQIYEQNAVIDRLQKQMNRLTKEETVSIAIFNELKVKSEEFLKCYDDAEKTSQDFQLQVGELNGMLKDRDAVISSLQNDIKNESKKFAEREQAFKQLQIENEKLMNELDVGKQKVDDIEKHRNRSLSEGRSSATMKDNKATKHLWDELSKKEARIIELEKQMKEKNRQITALKKAHNVEKEKQHHIINETKKVEVMTQLKELQEESEKRNTRIIMLEDALKESVSIAAEREDILARHVELSEEAAKKMSECEGEYDRVVVEKAITNIKNAFLILSLSERDALIASMRATKKRHVDELLNIKQEGLLASISEKDTQIAHFEISSKTRRHEIKQMKAEKEKLVAELKEQNHIRMTMLHNEENKENLIISELQDAPVERVYEAIRHLSSSTSKLEFYIEELISFLREKNVQLLKDVTNIPRKKARSIERLKKASRDDLLKELRFVEGDSMQLKKYVESLLDKLEGPP